MGIDGGLLGMVSLTFYGGVDEIGGNKVLLEDGDVRFFLDFGQSFTMGCDFFTGWLSPRAINGLGDYFEFGLLPKVKGLYAEEQLRFTGVLYVKPRFDAVFLSHAHFDHVNHIQFLDLLKVMIALYPFISRLNYGRSILGNIAEWLTPKKIKDKNLRVHLVCYAYLITVEGLFDELARILYYFIEASKGNIPSVQDLEKKTVWDILKAVKPTPIFLQNWDEKKHIRNAIGHARAYYDSTKNEIRFVDIMEKTAKTTYDKTISMRRLVEMALELEDSVAALYYIIIMLRLHDLIRSKKIYQ